VAHHISEGRLQDRSRVEAPEDLSGYLVHDPLGRRIGRLQEVFNNFDGEPEYLQIKVGLLGLRFVLIPVQSVRVDSDRRVVVLD